MPGYVDLHIHTYHSDGEQSPEEIVERSLQKKLAAIAITDHDSIAGVAAAQRASAQKIEIIPGVELSCSQNTSDLEDIHLLGLAIDPFHPALQRLLVKAKKARLWHKQAVVKKLQQLGFQINFKEVQSFARGEIGKPHIARCLMQKYPQRFKSVKQVFDEYLELGKPAYVKGKERLSLREGIAVIHQAEGVAILAHPGFYGGAQLEKLLRFFVTYHGDGLETYYVYEAKYGYRDLQSRIETNAFLRKKARQFGLILSGGSDFHGSSKPMQLGDAKVPYTVLEKLKAQSSHYR